MKKAMYVALTASIMLTISEGGGVTQAADYSLQEVVVTGERDKNEIQAIPGGYQNRNGGVGILGVKDTMDTPFQQTNLAQKTIDTFAANPSEQSTSVLVNVPSIRSAGNTLYNDFSIRGQKADAYQIRINGIPGLLSQTNIPMNMVERVEVISGPGIGVTGVQAKESAGGVINFQTKRAGDENITDYTTFFSGRGTWGNTLDVSHRLGEDKAWGIRLNAAYIDGETGIRDEEETQKNFSLNIDHKAERSSTNIFLGYRDTHTDRAQRYFDFSNSAITKLPGAPDSKNNYAFEGNELGMRTYMAAINHVQKIDDSFKVFINAGMAYNDGYDYLVNGSSRLEVQNNQGDFKRNIVNEPFSIRNRYIQFGANKTFDIGAVKNDLVVSYDKDWYEARWGSSPSNKGMVTGNLYNGVLGFDFITAQGRNGIYTGDSQFYGWTIADTLSYKKWDVTVGAHHHVSRVYSTSSGVVKTDATSPLFAIVYKPSDNWSVYANHSESFDAGTLVGSPSTYANAGEILDPVKTKSNEIGVKYTNGTIISALSYFDTTQDLTMDTLNESTGMKTKSVNGETGYKGIEWSFSGKIAPKWALSGGLLYIDSEYKKNTTSYLNGRSVMGLSDWSGVLTVEYEPSEDWDIWGRMVYTGSAPMYTNAGNELAVASSTVFDAGVRFRSHIASVPVTYNLTVFNLFDKDYWIPRPTYNYGILSNPRMVYLSATFHL